MIEVYPFPLNIGGSGWYTSSFCIVLPPSMHLYFLVGDDCLSSAQCVQQMASREELKQEGHIHVLKSTD